MPSPNLGPPLAPPFERGQGRGNFNLFSLNLLTFTMSVYIKAIRSWVDQLCDWLDTAQGKASLNIPIDEHKKWKDQLQQFKEQLTRPDISIAMIGPSQQGKSTLINAILGETILATGGSAGACTSAITSLHYRDQDRFTADIRLTSLENWRLELRHALEWSQRLQSSDLPSVHETQTEAGALENAENTGGDKEAQEEVDAAYLRLSAAYGREVNAIDAEFIQTTLAQTDLGLPADVYEKLSTDSRTITLDKDKSSDLRLALKPYVTGKSQNGSFVYWPLVQEVKIYGRFQALADGVNLVDLPGLDDPNEAREEITRKYLREARHVWLVCRAKTALTKTIVKLMRDENLLFKLFSEGRLPTFTIVATHIDDVPVDQLLDEMGHSPEAREDGVVSDDEIAQRYSASVIEAIKTQLQQSAARIIQKTQSLTSDHEKVLEFSKAVDAVPVIPVATKYYLKLIERERNYKPQIEMNLAQTRMPNLLEHLKKLTSADGMLAQATAIGARTDHLQNEIRFFFERRLNAFDSQTQARSESWQRMQTFAQDSCKGTKLKIGNSNELAKQRFVDKTRDFEVLLIKNRKLSVNSVQAKVNEWGNIHWSTLRAIVARDGVYYSRSSSKRYDLNEDLSNILMERIAFDWDRFFSDQLSRIIDTFADDLKRHLELYGERLIAQLHLLRNDTELVDLLQSNIKSAGVSFSAQTQKFITDLAGIIGRTRVELTSSVSETIKREMQSAYENASAVHGRGMKSHILAILSDVASHQASIIFSNTEQDLREGIRTLNLNLTGQLDKLATDAERKTGSMLNNVSVTELDTTDLAEAIDLAKQAIAELAMLRPALP